MQCYQIIFLIYDPLKTNKYFMDNVMADNQEIVDLKNKNGLSMQQVNLTTLILSFV